MRISYSSLSVTATALLLAAGAAVAQVVGEPSETEIATADCERAWGRSPASSSCTTTVLEAERAPGSSTVNNCAVKVFCASLAGGEHDTFSDYHGGPAGVQELVNCGGRIETSC